MKVTSTQCLKELGGEVRGEDDMYNPEDACIEYGDCSTMENELQLVWQQRIIFKLLEDQ